MHPAIHWNSLHCCHKGPWAWCNKDVSAENYCVPVDKDCSMRVGGSPIENKENI